jgi:aspartate aminotransferase-like enzyme
MKVYDAASIRNVAIVGHSGSGKTQLASAILSDASMVNRFGKVDEGTTVTDYDDEEIARKHTLACSLAYVEWNKTKINLVDTPGMANFLSDARAALRVSDGALVVVDAVSSLGAVPLETDAWGLDVVVSGSQKALLCPPGLAFASVSPAALEAAAASTAPRFVLDCERTRSAQAKLDAPFTPAVSLVRALDVALGLLLGEGLEVAFERHVRLGRACREGVKAMGLELFSPDEDRSAVVTAARIPDGIHGTEVVATLRDRFGLTVAGGQGELRGKIVRIGHIGWFDVFDITTALAALELVLADAGADIERGAAVTRALETYAERARV